MTLSRLLLKPAAVALLAAAALAWWALVVYAVRGGNWTALFLTGSAGPVPRALVSENVYVFPHTGYDSQFYHYLAHDPFLRRDFQASFDAPALRWRRILVPLCAWLLVAGQDRWIDRAFIAVMLALFYLGAWWMARYLEQFGLPAWWGLAYLLLPTSLITLDRLVVDLPLVTFSIGFLIYTREEAPFKLYLLLAAAILARETGLLLLVAWLLSLVAQRRIRAALFHATAALPAAAWFLYVASQTAPTVMLGWAWRFPFQQPWAAVQWFFTHPPANAIDRFAMVLDLLAIAGSALAIFLGLSLLRRPRVPGESAAAVFALFAVLLTSISDLATFTDIFGQGRILGPLTALLACLGAGRRNRLFLVPAATHSLRIGLTLGGLGMAAAKSFW